MIQKTQSLLSLAILSALCAGAIAVGCTVTSNSTNNNSGDGGTKPVGNTVDASPTDGDGDGDDGGDGGDGGAVCTGKVDVDFGETCQACLDEKCCDKLTACASIIPDDTAGTDCKTHFECESQCADADAGVSIEDCVAACEEASAPGVTEAVVAIGNCAQANCPTECGGS